MQLNMYVDLPTGGNVFAKFHTKLTDNVHLLSIHFSVMHLPNSFNLKEESEKVRFLLNRYVWRQSMKWYS